MWNTNSQPQTIAKRFYSFWVEPFWSIKDPFSGWDFTNESLDTIRETRTIINNRIEKILIRRKNE